MVLLYLSKPTSVCVCLDLPGQHYTRQTHHSQYCSVVSHMIRDKCIAIYTNLPLAVKFISEDMNYAFCKCQIFYKQTTNICDFHCLITVKVTVIVLYEIVFFYDHKC